MRKILLLIVTLVTMVFSANAWTNMWVEQVDGTKTRYNVENVTEVDYVTSNDDLQSVTVSGKEGNYTYVDLGLPSGTKWATYNVGASKPTEYGDYFAWGETTPKEEYTWANYKWCNGSETTLTKYCSDSEYGTVDGLTTLLAEDDAATQNWGAGWRMPTNAEQKELVDGCTWKWIYSFNGSGVSGYVGISLTNGNIIFLPGFCYTNELDLWLGLWSSSIRVDWQISAYLIGEDNYVYDGCSNYRYRGNNVRAVVNDNDTTITDLTVSGNEGDYTYVDLGLPSGTKWATYNVGASSPTEYGDYFAWGEVTPKLEYTWATYKWCDGSETTLTKYCVDSIYGTVDSLTTLQVEDDAATRIWGTGWRMPTHAEQQELIDGCTWKWIYSINGSGVAGYIGTSKTNGNTIFLPAAGNRDGKNLKNVGNNGCYWSSSIKEGQSYNCFFQFGSFVCSYGGRFYGHSIRAVVREIDTTKIDTIKIDIIKSDTTGTAAQGVTVSGMVGNYTYVDLGLPKGTKWATYNVGSSSPTEYGDYFAWGETTPKEEYTWATYKWCNGSETTLTKYCVDSTYGKVDSLTTLQVEDDAVTQNWGAGWRMPTHAEQQELKDGCTWEWTNNFNGSGVAGRIGKSKANGNTIFLPAAGNRDGKNLNNVGNNGCYWSSSINEGQSYNFFFQSSSFVCSYGGRFYGRSVRAVVK